jgi:thimet oligopeptidase
MLRSFVLWLPLFWLTACNTPEPPSAALPKKEEPPPLKPQEYSPSDVREFRETAARFHSTVSLPRLEQTPEQIGRTVSNTMARAEASLKAIASCSHGQSTFVNTIAALDDLLYDYGKAVNRLSLLKHTSTNAALREAATEATKTLSEWAVGIEYREDVYQTVDAYALTLPKLVGEDEKLLKEVLRDYRRAGLTLPKEQRQEVERLRKELARLTTDFDANIVKAQASVKFMRAQLDGVPEDFLRQPGIKTGDDEYTVSANVTFQYSVVMENAKDEATRRKLLEVQHNLAREQNVPILQKILELRDRIAHMLGYSSWADYQIEPKMARTAGRAREFLNNLRVGLQPKFEAELAEFQKLKTQQTGDANARIELWDWRYYSNQFKKDKYAVDAEQLRAFFPYRQVLQGMFRIYEELFGLKMKRLPLATPWVAELELYAVWDAQTAEPLGLFYLDMFPREGKYNHFAHFPIIEAKRLPGGLFQRPTVALICNFPPPSDDRPSLLSHADVETLFHEFGHALHSILTRANYARFSGTSVPLDFVEAPSQMLENWVWDKKVLDSFAADYRDPKKKIPKEILAKLKEAKLATIGTYYRRQIGLGLVDLALHTDVHAGGGQDCVRLANETLSSAFLPVPDNTAFVAYFGHLTGYDAGVYGYAWANAIAADLATAFEKAHHGYLDSRTGARLRAEIYAPGDSRDVNISIEKFLGRPQSTAPFLKTLGISGPH